MAGKQLTTLYLYLVEQDSPDIWDAFLLALRVRCVALRCLSLSPSTDIHLGEEILKATSGRLRKLEAGGHLAAEIEMYCKGLEELELRSSPGDTRFLRTIGPTLKVLEIWFREVPSRTHSKTLLQLMRNFSPKLCDISVRINPNGTTLLYSYGNQLLVLNMDQFAVEIRQQVVVACPRMRCKGWVAFSRDVGVLGAAVRVLAIIYVDGVGAQQLASDLEASSGIEELSIAVTEAHIAEDTVWFLQFHKQWMALIHLMINDKSFGDAALREVAKHASGLRNFRTMATSRK